MSYHNCTVISDSNEVYDPLYDPTEFRVFDTAHIAPNDSVFASSSFLQDSVQDVGGRKFRITDNCSLTVNVSIDITYNSIPWDAHIILAHTTTNGLVDLYSDPFTLTAGTTTLTATFSFECSNFNGEIYFSVFVGYVTPNIQPFTILLDSYYTVSDVTLIDNATITSEFPFNYLTGETMVIDMKQGEFLKELAKMYQWIFDTDERTHTVTARRFDNIKERIPQAVDLSDKIDANDIKITYGIDGFAQTNALKYKEDDISKYDAVGYINVADTTLKAEKDYVKMSELAATSTRLRFDTINAPYVPIFEELLPTNGLTDRIFLLKRVTFPYNINFNRVTDIPTDDVTFAYFAEAGNLDSLDFPTLIERFYQTVIDMNDRGKTVEASVNLKIKDVMNYDPLTPVYISSMGNYFYWEKLSNYVKDKLTKCKFVKI